MLVSRNVAVSKSRHRLLCSPTWKGQKHSKIPSLRMFLGSGGRFIEREGVSTLSIRGYPRALRYLLLCFQNLFAFQVCVGFEKVSFEKFLGNSCICPQECMKNLFENFLKVSV